MNRILAIEPDADRASLLRQLVRENLDADVVITSSADAAITAMSRNQPDLILTSMLLGASQEQDLVAHLRATPSVRHLPVLTIPAVTDPSIAETRSKGLFAKLLRRRQPEMWPAYNFNAVITRIAEGLEQSKAAFARAEAEARDAEAAIAREAIIETVNPGLLDSILGSKGSAKRARRWAMAELPWLSSVKLTWGQHLRLLNISSSGVLIESGVRLSPGSTTKFQIDGPEIALVVPAHIIRCRVSEVDSLGVKYETAAAFDQPVDVLTGTDEPAGAEPRLDDLIASVQQRAAHGATPSELRATFEAGVLELITAREVRLRDVPVVENDGRESVYFTVPTLDDAPAVLQVTFNPGDEPGLDDFAVLTAAAEAAATVLPLTGTTMQTTVHLSRPFRAARTLELQIA
jgi:CheY-like chemotaxis protein